MRPHEPQRRRRRDEGVGARGDGALHVVLLELLQARARAGPPPPQQLPRRQDDDRDARGLQRQPLLLPLLELVECLQLVLLRPPFLVARPLRVAVLAPLQPLELPLQLVVLPVQLLQFALQHSLRRLVLLARGGGNL